MKDLVFWSIRCVLPGKYTDRDIAIWIEHSSGNRMCDIASHYGISGARIWQIIVRVSQSVKKHCGSIKRLLADYEPGVAETYVSDREAFTDTTIPPVQYANEDMRWKACMHQLNYRSWCIH